MPDRLADFLQADKDVIEVLKAVRDVGPDGAFVAAGFIRNRVWDSFYPKSKPQPDLDIDVVYFDRSDISTKAEEGFEKTLDACLPTGIWQVRNQARMHSFSGYPPFENLADALAHWPETVTAIGARLCNDKSLEFVAPFGFDDLWQHVLRITPQARLHNRTSFEARVKQKGWLERWPNLTVVRD